MWKVIVGFVVFAAISLYVINKGGDKLDMSGEKHEVQAHGTEASAPASDASAAK